jgi:phosphoribosylformylglycinamidine (FGAM) synthase-like enzyme
MVVSNANGYFDQSLKRTSDFGNKFGQPLITGSILTFEHEEGSKIGFDKVIMQAGGWIRKISQD